MSRLRDEDKHILVDVVRRRARALQPLLDKMEVESLDADEVEVLQQALLDEMYEFGLDLNDEPNDYGKTLDRIVGIMQPLE